MHVCIFDLEHVKVTWGHLVHFSEKVCNSRTAHRRAKGTKKWASGRGGVHSMQISIFDLEHVSVIWIIRRTSKNWAVTQKRLIVEQKRQKFESQGCMENACWYF